MTINCLQVHAQHVRNTTEELYVILNLVMGGNWINLPTNACGLGRHWHAS